MHILDSTRPKVFRYENKNYQSFQARQPTPSEGFHGGSEMNHIVSSITF